MDNFDKLLEINTGIQKELVKIWATLHRNTEHLDEHMKRTNILESKIQKIVTIFYIVVGIGIGRYGLSILKLLGVIL